MTVRMFSLAAIIEPAKALLVCCCIIAIPVFGSHWFLPSTAFATLVTLLPGQLVAGLFFQQYADQPVLIQVVLAALSGYFAFLLPALSLHLIFRRRAPTLCAVSQYAWLSIYLLLFYVLLPVTWE